MANAITRQEIIELTKDARMSEFTSERIVERLTEKDLLKIQKIMKKHSALTITQFLRIFRDILNPTADEDFYLTYGLFRLFQQLCMQYMKQDITFAEISSLITEKMPVVNHDVVVKEKLYPMQLEVPDSIKKKIHAPEIIGKILKQRERLEEKPFLSDKFMHLNRRVGQSQYSKKNNIFLTMDSPSQEIKILNEKLQMERSLKTEQDLSKRDTIITSLTWSEHEERIACILGNYSLSIWAKEDNFRYEVNIPLPSQYLLHPYVEIKYMESSKKWYAVDNRPAIYILSSYNFEPEYEFTHFKMIKEKASEKMLITELKYRKLVCLAFQRNLFLISLEKKEIITQLRHFKTSITSIAFSETYQALFVSNFENYFVSYELSEHVDLTEKGKFEGHKLLISLIGVLEGKPVVYSLQQTSIMKLWDIRDFTCYQTFSVLKNILFHQVLSLDDSICLVGSKLYIYRWMKQTEYKEEQKILLIDEVEKNILVLTNKCVKLFNHSNGVLVKVIKGIFQTDIYFGFNLKIRRLLLLANQEGQTMIYSTKDFSIVSQIVIQPKPIYIYYDQSTDLIATCCLGQIQIFQFKTNTEFQLRRRIHNHQAFVNFCRISSQHDLIAAHYQNSKYLFFYSFEKGKALGFLKLDDFVDLEFLPQKKVLIILLTDKIIFFTYKKHVNSITFFLKRIIDLWQCSQFSQSKIKSKGSDMLRVVSTKMIVFEEEIIISSNWAKLQCKIHLKFNVLKGENTKLNTQHYNPYRISSQDHNEAFQMNKPSVVLDDSLSEQVLITKQYFERQGKANHLLLNKLGSFFAVTQKQNTCFYNITGEIKGILNLTGTLPEMWQLNNYSQQEIGELEYVYEFIKNESNYNSSTFDLTSMPNSKKIIKKVEELITMSMIMKQKGTSPIKSYKSNSLREKKMVLEKQRDEKEKYQNFLEHRKSEEFIKLKHVSRSTNEKYVAESIAFLNVNRNKLIMNKGIMDRDLPQIKIFQNKLNAAINKDDKKSIVSKYSQGIDFISPLKKITQEEAVKKAIELSFSQDQVSVIREQDFKERIKRLNHSVKLSKFGHNIKRAESLPALKTPRNSEF